MILVQEGIDIIKKFEGLRLTAYQDLGGIWTIGYGHTAGVKGGDVITEIQAEQMLMEDLTSVMSQVKIELGKTLNNNQFSALVSLAYNIGIGQFARSSLLRLIHVEQIYKAADEFLKWCHDGGKEIKGLLSRRQAERELFLKDIYA